MRRRWPPGGTPLRPTIRRGSGQGRLMARRSGDYPPPGSFREPAEFRGRLAELGCEIPCDDAPLSAPESPLAAPLATPLGRLENRFAVQPMEGWDGTADGRPSDLTRRRWERFGESGAALVWGGEAVAVLHEGRAHPHQLRIGRGHGGRPGGAARGVDRVASPRASGDAGPGRRPPAHAFRALVVSRSTRCSGTADRVPASVSRPASRRRGVDSPPRRRRSPTDPRRLGGRRATRRRGRFRFRRRQALSWIPRARTPVGAGPPRSLRRIVGGAVAVPLRVHRRDPFRGARAGDRRPSERFRRAALPPAVVGRRGGAGRGRDAVPLGIRPGRGRSRAHRSRRARGARGPACRGGCLGRQRDRRLPLLRAPHPASGALSAQRRVSPPGRPSCWASTGCSARRARSSVASPGIVVIASGATYLQEFLPHVAQAAVRAGWFDLVGLGRAMLSYPRLAGGSSCRGASRSEAALPDVQRLYDGSASRVAVGMLSPGPVLPVAARGGRTAAGAGRGFDLMMLRTRTTVQRADTDALAVLSIPRPRRACPAVPGHGGTGGREPLRVPQSSSPATRGRRGRDALPSRRCPPGSQRELRR